MAEPRADPSPVLGELPATEVIDYLESIDDPSAALELRTQINGADESLGLNLLPFDSDVPAWQHTDHAFGFVRPPSPEDGDRIPLIHVNQIPSSSELKGKLITVALDRLRIKEYPGRGIHNVSFNFIANHDVKDTGISEEVRFSQVYRIQDDEGAGIQGYPVFQGLSVGNVGVSFKGFTVNVSNDNDEAMLNALDSDVFKNGLKLITTANPAIKPLTGLAEGVAKAFLSRNKNKKVQDFYLGLDFGPVVTRARLAVGSYVVIQHPRPDLVEWNRWSFNRLSGEIVADDGYNTRLQHNYLVFSVSEFDG